MECVHEMRGGFGWSEEWHTMWWKYNEASKFSKHFCFHYKGYETYLITFQCVNISIYCRYMVQSHNKYFDACSRQTLKRWRGKFYMPEQYVPLNWRNELHRSKCNSCEVVFYIQHNKMLHNRLQAFSFHSHCMWRKSIRTTFHVWKISTIW